MRAQDRSRPVLPPSSGGEQAQNDGSHDVTSKALGRIVQRVTMRWVVTLGGVDKFHSATAGGKNRQFKEARKRNIGNIARRADAEKAVFGPAPQGLPYKRPWQRCSALQEAHSCFVLAPPQGLLQGNRGVVEFVHAA